MGRACSHSSAQVEEWKYQPLSRHLFRWCQKIRVAVALPRSRERPDFKRPEQARYASGKQGEVRKNIGVAEPWHQTMGENQAGEYATADLALQI